MKSTHYTEKHSDHIYQSSHTTTLHQVVNSTIPKKSSTMKKFEQCIVSNTMQTVKLPKENHYNFFNELSHSTNLSNPPIMKPKKPTQKPIHQQDKAVIQHFVKEYQKIISNLSHYYKYYQWMLMKEIEKHDNYFAQIIKIVENQKKNSRQFLLDQVKALEQRIQLQKAVVQNKIANLENSNVMTFQRENAELLTQKSIEIPLFELNLKKIDLFKTQIKKYIFEVVDSQQLQNSMNEDKQSIADTISLEASIKTEKKEPYQTADDLQLQEQITELTPIEPQPRTQHPQPLPKPAKPITVMQDEDLYCDQDIENIIKENKIVRKKRYQCKDDAIPEQSQSHEDSLVMSHVQALN